MEYFYMSLLPVVNIKDPSWQVIFTFKKTNAFIWQIIPNPIYNL